MDVTGSLTYLYDTPERIAYLLKARIRHDFGITCSVGIAPNKLLAKLASEMHKPDGLTVIRPEEVARVMEWTADQGAVRGRAEDGAPAEHDEHLHLRRTGPLRRSPPDPPLRGHRQTTEGDGPGDRQQPGDPAGEEAEVKSVGHCMTLTQDVSAREDILRYLLQLAEMVGRRARRYGVSGRTVHLYVRYADFFSSFGKQETLKTLHQQQR